MRSYQILYLLLFLIFYLVLTHTTFKSVARVLNNQLKKTILWIIYSYSIIFILVFVYIYIWPSQIGKNGDYSITLIFNAVLSADFAFKIITTLTFLLSLIFKKKNRAIVSWTGLIISTGIVINIFYSTIFEKNNVVVTQEELQFENLPAGFERYKIMHISDIHLGSYMHSKRNLQQTSKVIQKYKPDALFFTGDLVNNYSEELKGWGNIFKAMNKGITSISILGNHDYGDYSQWDSKQSKNENFNNILEAHDQFGFQLLRNENTVLKKGNDSIYVIGVENWGHAPFPQYADLDKSLMNVPDNSFKILLSHDPNHWESVIKYMDNINLTLSGHTHGMQWGIKKSGITFSLMYFVSENWGGLYRYGKSKLYVNTGLGMIGFPWRINMPGEITLLTLKRIEVDGKQ